MAHGDSARGRDALAALDFFVHADLFLSPTAEQADIVLPVASPFEAEALRIGFEVSQEAQSLVQLRRPVQAPRGEARSDLEIVFALATRLGLGDAASGTATSTPRGDTSSRRAGSRSSSSARSRPGSGCR